MHSETEHVKTAGRPKDPQIDDLIKSAVLDLLRDNPFQQVSIAAIAKAAGVSKQTLYNRWNTKADLVLDAVFEEAGRIAALPADDPNITCRDQLLDFLCQIFAHLDQEGQVIKSLIAAAQEDANFGHAFRTRFVEPRDQMVVAILQRAQHRHEISQARDLYMLSSFVHGAFWYALLNDRPLDHALANSIVDEIFAQPD